MQKVILGNERDTPTVGYFVQGLMEKLTIKTYTGMYNKLPCVNVLGVLKKKIISATQILVVFKQMSGLHAWW